MADVIRLTASQVEELASQFTNASTETEELLNRLGQNVLNAASGWEGDSYTKFESKFEEVRSQMRSVVQMYEDFSTLLKQVVQVMQETDTSMASAMG